jgi:hypothetical protein
MRVQVNLRASLLSDPFVAEAAFRGTQPDQSLWVDLAHSARRVE